MDKINENLDLINSLVQELKEEFKRKNQTIKDLKKKVNKIERNKNFWYKKCQEYEKLLFENKIPYNDLPF